MRGALQGLGHGSLKGHNLRNTSHQCALHIQQASKLLDIELAERLFTLMKEEGVPRKQVHYEPLFSLFLHLDKPNRLEFYIDLMKVDGLRPSLSGFNRLLQLHSRRKNKEKAEAIFQRMTTDEALKPDRTTYSTLLTLYSRIADVEGAETNFSKLKEVGKPLYRDYSTLLSAYTRSLLLDKAEALFRELQDKQFQAKREDVPPQLRMVGLYCSMIDMYSKMSNLDKAEEYFSGMKLRGIKPDSAIYCAMVDMYAKNLRLDRLNDMLGEMESQGIRKPTTFYAVMLNLYLKLGDVENAERLFQQGWEEGRYNTIIFSLMILLHSNFQNISRMDEILEMARREDMVAATTFLGYFRFYVEQRDVEKAGETWKEMVKRGWQPTDAQARLLLQLYASVGKEVEGSELLTQRTTLSE